MARVKKQLRDRTQELLRIPAAQIEGAIWNWRVHSKAQLAALSGATEDVGFVAPLLVRPLGEGRYQLVDGHARQGLIAREVGPDTLIPCVVLDLDEGEAKLANATLDPLAALAEADKDKLDALLREVHTGDEHLAKMLDDLAREHGLCLAEEEKEEPGEAEDVASKWEVVVTCSGESQQRELFERLSLEGFACRVLGV